jgi:NAD(P)-dependent dehydrogenase (short-subunit alcohol dehydrogenase family)
MGQKIIVTGATSGIGKSLALALVKAGHVVYATGRSLEKLAALKEAARSEKLIPVLMDFSSFKSIDLALKKLLTSSFQVDLLINNAAATSAKKIITEDGFEMQLQVNHFVPVYLTMKLLPYLEASQGFVITTASNAHKRTTFNPRAMEDKTMYRIFKRYQETKLYNLMMTRYFKRIYQDSPVDFYAVHPGLVKTDLGSKNASKLVDIAWKLFNRRGMDPEGPIPTYLKIIQERPQDGTYYAYEKKEPYLPVVDDESKQDILMNHAFNALKLEKPHA